MIVTKKVEICVFSDEIAECLKNAKEFLWQGLLADHSFKEKEEYICHAVERTDAVETVKIVVKAIIAERLTYKRSGYGYYNYNVTSYLRGVVKVPEEQLTPKNVQEFRHRWVDELIKEFSK